MVSLAIRYVLAMARVACAIPGFRNERKTRCTLAEIGRMLIEDDIAFVQQTLLRA
jgi:hypothetical protein